MNSFQIEYFFIILLDDEGNAEYYGTVLRLSLAVLCPVAILSIVLSVILLMMRKWHRRRMAHLAIIEGSQGLDHTDYTYRDELRVTAAGDSTLRVFLNLYLIFFLKLISKIQIIF